MQPHGIFVNTNDTVYGTFEGFGHVQIWFKGSIPPATINLIGIFFPSSLFVTITGNIYVETGVYARFNESTSKWSVNLGKSDGPCFGLFADINDNIYCSVKDSHQVIKKLSNNITNPSIIVAGTEFNGSLSNMLDSPYGIFVDINFNLYVADNGNNRIQLFKPEELNATTLAGEGAPGTITLKGPTGIVLDADNYLFIVDQGNNRIVRSSANGFRCLVGCSGSNGSASNELDRPFTLSFDSYGNMFVTDFLNDRIQKFVLSMNSCSKCLKIFK
jgi:hypothetical protein